MRHLLVTLACLTLMIAVVSGARAVTAGTFRPASAAELRLGGGDALSSVQAAFGTDGVTSPSDDLVSSHNLEPSPATSAPLATLPQEELETSSLREAPQEAPSLGAAIPVSAAAPAPAAPAAALVSVPRPATATAAPPVAAAAVATTPAPAPVVAATPVPAPVVAATPVPAPVAVATPVLAPVVAAPTTTCAATWFCYPRLGIAGPIVPYADCLGQTDIGDGIRSFTCISPFYLMGHAYTQFGAVTGWQAGDVVYASGRRFVISTAFVQNSCEPPAGALAPISLQTSLSSGGCGRVLVVQGR